MRLVFTRTDERLPLFVESIGDNEQQEAVQRIEGYPYVHWLQTVKGEGYIQIADKKIQLPIGRGILLNSHIPHFYDTQGEWATCYFTFGGHQLAAFLAEIQLTDYLLVDTSDAPLDHFITNLLSDIHSNAQTPTQLSIATYAFLLYLNNHKITNEQTSKQYQTIVEPLMAYLEANYALPINLKLIEKQMGYSSQYLNSIFQQVFHQTVLQYLNDIRLRKAKGLLVSEPNWTIAQVADAVGYLDLSYFIANFKKHTGQTPGQFKGWF